MSNTFFPGGAKNFAGGVSPKVKFFTVVARYVSPLDEMPVYDFSVYWTTESYWSRNGWIDTEFPRKTAYTF